jgi:hypothetical protein
MRRSSCSLLIASLLWWGCSPQTSHGPSGLRQNPPPPLAQTALLQGAQGVQRDTATASQNQTPPDQLQLVERPRELTPAHGLTAAPSSGPEPGSAALAAPHAAPAGQLSEPTGTRPLSDAQPKTDASAGGPSAVPAAAGPSAAPASLTRSATDQRLADAQKRIVRLEQQLSLEVQRRRDVEGEVKRLLQETSAGPFERADNVVEKHLREELDRARKEIGQLRATLATERREHEEIERAYAALQAQVQASDPARVGASSEEIEALRERQRRVLASIQQDLEASKQREAGLRQSVEQLQGGGAVSLSDAMSNLRSENSALQMRLDEEHQRNRDLAAKLQLATRVTDLIFRMRQGSDTQAVAVAQPAAAR